MRWLRKKKPKPRKCHWCEGLHGFNYQGMINPFNPVTHTSKGDKLPRYCPHCLIRKSGNVYTTGLLAPYEKYRVWRSQDEPTPE